MCKKIEKNNVFDIEQTQKVIMKEILTKHLMIFIFYNPKCIVLIRQMGLQIIFSDSYSLTLINLKSI